MTLPAAPSASSSPASPAARPSEASTHADRLAACIQCGLCLPACPTYALTPFERANPRGRIRLMRAVAEGEMDAADAAYGRAMHECLGCRACETACPAGVEFGQLLQTARAELEAAGSPGRPAGFPRDWLLDRVLPWPWRLRLGARLLRLYRRTLGRVDPWRRWVARRWPGLAELEAAAPDVPPQGRRWRLPRTLGPGAGGTADPPLRARGTVAIHPGCVQAVLLPEVAADTAQVLAYNAWRVVVPEFRCCGALHAHHGRLDRARALARVNVAAFETSGAGHMVSSSAGCGAFMEEYGTLLADDHAWSESASRFSAAVRDVTEHLVGEGVRRPRRPFGLSVTYHDACHLIHGQRVAEAPRMLLGAIRGLESVPLPESTWCCGSAGIHNLTHPEQSEALLERKIANVATTGASLVVTGNPGCMLQIASGLRRADSGVRVLHTVSLLRAAYELPSLLPAR